MTKNASQRNKKNHSRRKQLSSNSAKSLAKTLQLDRQRQSHGPIKQQSRHRTREVERESYVMNPRWPGQATLNSPRNSAQIILENQTDKKLPRERVLRKTVEIIERSFTTKPSIRRKKTGHSLVRRIAQELVESWYPETIVAYEAMDRRLLTQFERCDKKTRLAYLGRPATRQVERIEQQVRYRKTGTITHKDHTFTHRLPAKKGYLEIFGLTTLFTDRDGKAWFRLHHTIQETLARQPPIQRVNAGGGSNKIFLCVNSVSSRVMEQAQVNVVNDVVYSETEKRESVLTERENRSSESILTLEEMRILGASKGSGGPPDIEERRRLRR